MGLNFAIASPKHRCDKVTQVLLFSEGWMIAPYPPLRAL